MFRRALIASVFYSFVSVVVTSSALAASIKPEEALEKVKSGALLIDVRSEEEFEGGHLPGALNIPHDQMVHRVAELGKNTSRQIVFYCRTGRRAGIADEVAQGAGFKATFNAGGYDDLKTIFTSKDSSSKQ
jgi:phage shock protein E